MTKIAPDMAISERLLRSSAKQSYDPDVDIDWDAPLAKGKWGMVPERLSLYGTDLWDELTEEQQITLSIHESAAICSVGIWFEIMLMQLLLRDAYDDDPKSAHMQYALTEVADECRHSVMFGKAIDKFDVPAYGPPNAVVAAGRMFAHRVSGPASYGSILVAEEVLDTWQREMMRDDRVQPLVRMVSRIHVLEEARHMTYARDEVKRMVPGLSKRQLLTQQAMLAKVSTVVVKSLVNSRVYRSVGIDPRVGRKAALSNPHYQSTLQWMSEKPTRFLRDQGLIPKRQESVWRSAYMIP